jgi:outer membrane protein TolC
LLELRPDLRAIRRRIEAADRQVGAAIANRFPAIRLTGSLGLSSTEPENLFDDTIFGMLASLVQSVFDGGQRSAEIDRRKAIVEELLATYGQLVLQALVEVENAIVQERHQRDHIASVEEQLVIARDTLREARNRYAEGLSDFLPVLNALVSLEQIEQSLLQAKRQLLSYRIQLYRALGGSWTTTLEPAPEVAR